MSQHTFAFACFLRSKFLSSHYVIRSVSNSDMGEKGSLRQGGTFYDIFLQSVSYRPTLGKFRGGPVKKNTLQVRRLVVGWSAAPGCGTCSEGTRSTPGSGAVIFAKLGTKTTLNYFFVTLSCMHFINLCQGHKYLSIIFAFQLLSLHCRCANLRTQASSHPGFVSKLLTQPITKVCQKGAVGIGKYFCKGFGDD